MHYVVVDLEATVRKYKGQPIFITEIGAIKLNSNLKLVSKFHSFVKPTDKNYVADIVLDDKLLASKKDLKNSRNINIVIDRFKRWIYDEEYILIFWSYADLDILIGQYQNRKFDLSWLKNYCDLQSSFSDYIKSPNQVSLKKAIKYIKADFIGEHHNALNDAYNTAKILVYLLEKSAMIKFNLNPFERISSPLYKKCSLCKEVKHHTKFKRLKGKPQARCRVCMKARIEENRARREPSNETIQ